MWTVSGTTEGQGDRRTELLGTPISSGVIFSRSPWEKANGLNNLELEFNMKGGRKDGRIVGSKLTRIY